MTARHIDRSVREAWTAEEIRSLGTRCDLVTAGRILGVGKNKVWELYHSGQLPVPALKLGRRVVVPLAPLLDLLGLSDTEPDTASERPRLRVADKAPDAA